jgi:uncharacterized protein YecT (DUF1311 family)
MKYTLIIILLCASIASKAQEHPLDKKFEKAYEEARKNNSNGALAYEMISESMIIDWDKELNHAYKTLMSKLSSEKQTQLRASQRKWIEFRDAEFTLLRDIDKTAMYPQPKTREMKYVRQRALELIELTEIM